MREEKEQPYLAAPLKIRMDKKGTALQKVFGQLS